MSPPAGKTKSRRRAAPAQDQPQSAGRGRAIPRASLGADTLLGVAQTQRRTLGQVVNIAATGTTGAFGYTTNILNSAYHADGSGDADGFQKIMAFYSKCFVIGCRVLIHGTANVTTNSAIVGATITTNVTSLGSYAHAITNGMSQWTLVYKNPDRFSFNLGVDVKKFFNKPFVLDDAQLFCTASATPTQQIILHTWVQDDGNNTQATLGFAELLFDCVFTDPVPFT